MSRVRRLGTMVLIAVVAVGVWVPGSPVPATAQTRPEFAAWLEVLRREARAAGISEKTLRAALADLELIPEVIELDRRQPEFRLTLEAYLERVVPDSRVAQGRRELAENRRLLAAVSRRYGVQPRFLVAFWGVETDFGRVTGGFPVVGALASLAYDGRRRDFFRGELLAALHILDAGHVGVPQMVGSWAGAMGQPQFMPSTFRRFAVDFDGDGRTDIWSSRGDVFASAANFLSRLGWKGAERWGREVHLPPRFDRSLIGLQHRKPLTRWRALGVRRANDGDLPTTPDLLASVVQPDGLAGRAFVVYDNYRAILRWNRSHLFGIAVGILADRIGGV